MRRNGAQRADRGGSGRRRRRGRRHLVRRAGRRGRRRRAAHGCRTGEHAVLGDLVDAAEPDAVRRAEHGRAHVRGADADPDARTAPKPSDEQAGRPRRRHHGTTTAPFRFPVPVSVGNAHQVVTVSASRVVRQRGRLAADEPAAGTPSCRPRRRGSAPTGRSPRVQAQAGHRHDTGRYVHDDRRRSASPPNPGARLPYHRVTSDDWWVEDNNSAYYNRCVARRRVASPSRPPGVNGSEHLITLHHAVPVRRRHRLQPAAERRALPRRRHLPARQRDRCDRGLRVGARWPRWCAIIDWLDPAQHPRIAIG